MNETYFFKIKSDIPSKKNGYRVNLNPGIITYIKELIETKKKPTIKDLGKFARLRPTKKYEEWESNTVKELISQIKGNLYLGKVEIWFTIYFPKKGRAGGDSDNKATSIFDALTKAGIVMDDSYNCVPKHHVKGVYRKGKGGAEIKIKNLTEDF
jgi:Holliday junction resolvase RusA-like endonuclease